MRVSVVMMARATALKLSGSAVSCLACIGVAALLLLHPAEEKIATYSVPVNEANVTVPEGGLSTGEGLSAAGMAAGAAPTPRSPPQALTGFAADPVTTAKPVTVGGIQQEAARPVAMPDPAAAAVQPADA